jgi:DUF1680 family protein
MQNKFQTGSLTRRNFSTILAGAGIATPALASPQSAQDSATSNAAPQQNRPAPGNFRRAMAPDTPAFDEPLTFSRNEITFRAQPFSMNQVRLLPSSIYFKAQEWNRGYMSRLAADRLLYTFHANAGLPVGSAKPLGGWEQPDNGQRSSELRGHFVGHYLSASAQLAANGDTEAKAKADYMVAEMAKCQQRLGGKYLSAFPPSWFDRLERGERVWAPFYTVHKIMAGLFDMYRLAGNKEALQVVEGMSAWADDWTAPKSEPAMQEILKIEFGGMAETLYNVAEATDNIRYAAAGDRFQKKSFINPLAAHRDELRGLHANTHIPQAIAAARRYDISSDKRFYDVADYFLYEVSNSRAYVSGGTSNAEAWLAPPRRLAAEWKLSVNTTECCCAYNMLKLTRHLYSWNPQPAYFDYYERLLLNHRIGTIRPELGYTQYYLGLTSGVWKTFNTEDQTFWCCTGSGVEEYSKLNNSIYWHDDQGLYVNLFVPSELDWTEKGFKLRQETSYPESETTTLTIIAAPRQPMLLRVRMPGWLQSTPTVRVNGKLLEASAGPGYLTLNRVWKAGDRVDVRFPMQLRVESMSDDRQIQAFMYGPLLLAGDLGGEGLTQAHIIGPNLRIGAPNVEQFGSALAASNSVPPIPDLEIPTFKAKSDDPASWIKPGDKPLMFHSTGQAKNVQLVPLYQLFDRRYAVYWQVS